MPFLITALTRSATKNTAKKNQITQKITAKTHYLNLKGNGNNVSMQSHKNLNYPNLLFLNNASDWTLPQ